MSANPIKNPGSGCPPVKETTASSSRNRSPAPTNVQDALNKFLKPEVLSKLLSTEKPRTHLSVQAQNHTGLSPILTNMKFAAPKENSPTMRKQSDDESTAPFGSSAKQSPQKKQKMEHSVQQKDSLAIFEVSIQKEESTTCQKEESTTCSEEAFSMQLLELQKLQSLNSVDIMISEIFKLFPELKDEIQNSPEKLKEILTSIIKIQNAGSFVLKKHWSKDQTGLAFTFDVISHEKAYIEVKRTSADKCKAGGESKFSRLIGLENGHVTRAVGLKIRFNQDDRERAIAVRLAQSEKFQSLQIDPTLNAVPLNHVEFESKNGLKQLLSVYEDLGSDILAASNQEQWDFATTIKAMSYAGNSLVDLHQKGLLHRDIKPANILGKKDCYGNLTIKLGDFGFLLTMEESQQKSYAGTLEFVSLRQFQRMLNKDPSVHNDVSSDLYAFGLSLLQMVEKTQDFPNVVDQIEYFLEKSNNQELKNQLKDVKTQMNHALLIGEKCKMTGLFLAGLKRPELLPQVCSQLGISEQGPEYYKNKFLDFLHTFKNDLFKAGNKVGAHRMVDEVIEPYSVGKQDALDNLAEMLKMINWTSLIQYHTFQNYGLGLILPSLRDIKDYPTKLVKTYELIHDLMIDPIQLKTSSELTVRFEEIISIL